MQPMCRIPKKCKTCCFFVSQERRNGLAFGQTIKHLLMISLLAIPALILIIAVVFYNRFVRMRNEVRNALGNVDVYLKKRYDLLPNLISVVKKYAAHEKELLSQITALRSQAGSLKSAEDRLANDKEFTAAMKGFMVNVEAYPDLKASENFGSLQRSLNELEAQLAAARRSYNGAVTDYNTSTQMFPGNLLAGMFGFGSIDLIEVSETERQNIDVGSLL